MTETSTRRECSPAVTDTVDIHHQAGSSHAVLCDGLVTGGLRKDDVAAGTLRSTEEYVPLPDRDDDSIEVIMG